MAKPYAEPNRLFLFIYIFFFSFQNLQTLMKSPSPSEKEETFADIDDSEVKVYLNNKTRTRLKTLIWESMNSGYLEEQATKKAVVPSRRSRAEEKLHKDRKRKPVKDRHAAGEKTKKPRSSAVNYDALKSLIPDFDRGDEEQQYQDRSEWNNAGAAGANGDDRSSKSDEMNAFFNGGYAGDEYEQDYRFGDEDDYF